MTERHDDLDYVAEQIKRLNVKNVTVNNEDSTITWGMDGKEKNHISYFVGLQNMLVNVVKSKYWKLDILASASVTSVEQIKEMKKTGFKPDKDSERILILTRTKPDRDGVITESMRHTIKDSLDRAGMK